MLPTHSFHVVFTLPRELRRLALANRKVLFNILFACAADTLISLGRDGKRLGGDLGITSLLHTWQRDLRFHPHVHCIVTGGGLSRDGSRWIASRPDFLFPVRVMGRLFRGKLIAALRRARDNGWLSFVGPAAPLADQERFDTLLDKLSKKRWVVYCKPPFGDNEHAFQYLGQYTHRVGLSNHRLISLDERGVTFRTRGGATVTVSPVELLRRFMLHVLPKGFVKIRHHGLFAPSNVDTKLAAARQLLEGEPPPASAESASATPTTLEPTGASHDFRDDLRAATGRDLRRCSACGALAVVRHPLAPRLPRLLPALPPRPPNTS
jgi:hypothetical protein